MQEKRRRRNLPFPEGGKQNFSPSCIANLRKEVNNTTAEKAPQSRPRERRYSRNTFQSSTGAITIQNEVRMSRW